MWLHPSTFLFLTSASQGRGTSGRRCLKLSGASLSPAILLCFFLCTVSVSLGASPDASGAPTPQTARFLKTPSQAFRAGAAPGLLPRLPFATPAQHPYLRALFSPPASNGPCRASSEGGAAAVTDILISRSHNVTSHNGNGWWEWTRGFDNAWRGSSAQDFP